MMRTPTLRALFAAALLFVCAVSLAQIEVPPLRAPVTDLTQTLSADETAALEQRLRAFESRHGSQIAILLVPSTEPETIEQYSIRVAEQWQLGRKGVDDGVLVLVAKQDRAVRIEVGYGLEGALPDVIAHRITNQVIVPRFREGDFSGGLSEAVTRIVAVIEGEPLPGPERRERTGGLDAALSLLLLLLFAASGMMRRLFGAIGGASMAGGAAALLVWRLTGGLAMAIGAAAIAVLFALFGGGRGGGSGWTRQRRGGWGGGLGGSSGGFGGGGGGWSGGGGSFGGGGASGRW